MLLEMPDVGEDRDFERPEDRGRPVELLPARYQCDLRAAQGRASERQRHGLVRRGRRLRRDPDSAAALDRWVALLTEAHGDRVLPIDRAIVEEWGRMNVPDPLPVVDGLLAATARILALTLVTRNVDDVVGAGVEVLDPFAQ